MTDFAAKVRAIDEARKKYITFDNEFREYIASGNSFNGAYNFFSIMDIEKHKELSIVTLELEAWETLHGETKDSSPIKLSKYDILSDLEIIDDSIS
jgi:hypothetical protein